MSIRWYRGRLSTQFGLLLLLVIPNVCQGDRGSILYVNNRNGNDRLSGDSLAVVSSSIGPLATIQGAIQRARPGDLIRVINTGYPYRERLSIDGTWFRATSRHPVTIEGNGAELAGAVSVDQGGWYYVGKGIYRLQRLSPETFMPQSPMMVDGISHHVLERFSALSRPGWPDLPPLVTGRLFRLVPGGSLSRFDNIPTWEVPLSQQDRLLPTIPAGHFAFHQGSVLFHPVSDHWNLTKENAGSGSEVYAFTDQPAALLIHRASHLVFRDLAFVAFGVDGVQLRGPLEGIRFEHCKFAHNTRTGLAAYAGARADLTDCYFESNAVAGVRAEGSAVIRLDRCRINDSPIAALTVDRHSAISIEGEPAEESWKPLDRLQRVPVPVAPPREPANTQPIQPPVTIPEQPSPTEKTKPKSFFDE